MCDCSVIHRGLELSEPRPDLGMAPRNGAPRPRIAFTRPDERSIPAHLAHGIPRASSFAAPVGGAMARHFAPGFREQPALSRPRAASDAGPSGVGRVDPLMSGLLGVLKAGIKPASQSGLERLGKQRSASFSERIAPGPSMPRQESATHVGEAGHLGASGDESLMEGAAAASSSSLTSNTFYHGDPMMLACSRLLLSCDGADPPRITIVHADKLTGSTYGYEEGGLVGRDFFPLVGLDSDKKHSERKEITKAVKKRERITKVVIVKHGPLNTDPVPGTVCSVQLRPMVGLVAPGPAASQSPVHYLAIVREKSALDYMRNIRMFEDVGLDQQFEELERARRRNRDAHGGAELQGPAPAEQDAATPGLSARLLQVGLDAAASPVTEARGPLAALGLATGDAPVAV